MRAIVQRVISSEVVINEKERRFIGNGLLIFVGIEENDGKEDIDWLCGKIVRMRIFDDEHQIMNLSVKDIHGEIMVISQFTLNASTKKGNRPSYIKAAKAEISEPMYELFLKQLAYELGKVVVSGEFGAYMKITLVNNGPVTIFIDSKNKE